MNAYVCDAGMQMYVMDTLDVGVGSGIPIHDYENEFAIVFAKTRGQARAIYAREFDHEFTAPFTCRLFRKGIDREPGIAEWDDPLWQEGEADDEPPDWDRLLSFTNQHTSCYDFMLKHCHS